ncbi:hypothetical protein RHIZ404_200439 [Rhizobium sp. EC-SD404]|nr:hypothetical protein RHIZ404_200439 [Rhizobium sp. EC-SD404]
MVPQSRFYGLWTRVEATGNMIWAVEFKGCGAFSHRFHHLDRQATECRRIGSAGVRF